MRVVMIALSELLKNNILLTWMIALLVTNAYF